MRVFSVFPVVCVVGMGWVFRLTHKKITIAILFHMGKQAKSMTNMERVKQ